MRFSKLRRYLKPGLCALAWLTVLSQTLAANIVVIGNPQTGIKHLNQNQITSLYLGNSDTVEQHKLSVYDLANSSDDYQNFYQNFMGWSLDQISSYWSQKVFSGGADQPEHFATAAQAIRYVSATPGAIAYVDAKALSESPDADKVSVLYGQALPNQGLATAPLNLSSQHHSLLASNSNHSGPQNLSTAMIQNERAAASRKVIINKKPLDRISEKLKTPQKNLNANLWQSMTADFSLQQYYNNKRVTAQVRFLLAHPSTMQTILNNAIPYIAYVYQQVKQNNMPGEIALIPMLESYYNPYAYSRVGAAGLWQMMPQTATLFGLKISWWHDDRRDVLLSTKAAITYFNQLHRHLSSWLLVAAGYDAGQTAIDRAIKNNKNNNLPSDYWNLKLPRETQNYTPRMLALAEIISHPHKYHVTLPKLTITPFFTPILLQSQMDMGEIAQFAKISENLVRYLNPGLRRYATNPDSQTTILLPTAMIATFVKNLDTVIGKKHISWIYHNTYRNESLEKIARDYHCHVSELEHVNDITDGKTHPGQGLLVPVQLNARYTPAIVDNINTQTTSGNVAIDTLLSKNSPHDLLSRTQAELSQALGAKNIHSIFATHSFLETMAFRKLFVWFLYNLNLLH